MSTLTTINVQTENLETVAALLEQYLGRNSRNGEVTRAVADDPGGIYGDDFVNSAAHPTKFALAAVHSGWVIAHYNSFCDCEQLLKELSKELRCLAVHVMAQTTSDAYHITVYREGAHQRTLQFADGDWAINTGTPFEFETDPLGTDIGEAGEPLYDFSQDDVAKYCENLGLDVWDDYNERWTILSINQAAAPSLSARLLKIIRPTNQRSGLP